MAGEISTQGIQLMTSTDGTAYTKVCDIKDFPDLGGAPELIEVTTLTDTQQRYINGIKQVKALEFTANYDDTVYDTLDAMTGTKKFAVWFGNSGTGADGKFQFDGQLAVWPVGGKGNAPIEMKISIAPSTVITKVTA
jgi:hypothetical protein